MFQGSLTKGWLWRDGNLCTQSTSPQINSATWRWVPLAIDGAWPREHSQIQQHNSSAFEFTCLALTAAAEDALPFCKISVTDTE
jgi:hypothetical protein